MTRMTFDAQHFRDHWQLLTGFAGDCEHHTTADLRQLTRQVDQRSFRSDVLRRAFRDDVGAARFVPLRFHFEARKIAWSRSIVAFELPDHSYSSSARSFSTTEKSSRA